MTRLSIALAATAACLAAPLAAQTSTAPASAPPPIAAMVDTPCLPADALPPAFMNMMRVWFAPPAERAAIVRSLAPEQRALMDVMRAAVASPVERPALLQALTPEQRAQAEAMGAEMSKKQADQKTRDWPNLCKYKAENAQVIASGRPDIVFMGDSITEGWRLIDPTMFNDKIIDRGISGQTSPQMLVRFMQDVVSLRPRAVHILAGTNDVAGNTGPNAPDDYKNNIRAMAALAKANGIAVILGSILPANHFIWRPDLKPAPQIVALNTWLRDFAAENHLGYVDYYSALVDGQGGLRSALTPDGVHPNQDGYAVMRPLAQAAIRAAR
jgi:lysophospholipase L1-like esterase